MCYSRLNHGPQQEVQWDDVTVQQAQRSEGDMSQSYPDIYRTTPQDIPRSHAYMRHRQDNALRFIMEALQFRVEIEIEAQRRRVCHLDNASGAFYTSARCWCFSSAPAEGCNRAGGYPTARAELGVWHTQWHRWSSVVNFLALQSRRHAFNTDTLTKECCAP